MFGLFSKKKEKQNSAAGFGALQTDMHSHLLPGIDDGARHMEESLELIRGLKALGFKKLITTPHVLWDMYRNTPEIINKKLETVRQALRENDIDIELYAAAEYFLDEHMERLIKEKQPLVTIKDNMVLVEFSVMHMSINMKELIFDLQMAGYQPVLAHPERYVYLNKNREIFDELRANGVLFQLNLLSATGGYGKSVLELAQYFLKNGFYSVVGTDLHHAGHLQRLKDFKAPPELQELLSSPQLLNAQL